MLQESIQSTFLAGHKQERSSPRLTLVSEVNPQLFLGCTPELYTSTQQRLLLFLNVPAKHKAQGKQQQVAHVRSICRKRRLPAQLCSCRTCPRKSVTRRSWKQAKERKTSPYLLCPHCPSVADVCQLCPTTCNLLVDGQKGVSLIPTVYRPSTQIPIVTRMKFSHCVANMRVQAKCRTLPGTVHRYSVDTL